MEGHFHGHIREHYSEFAEYTQTDTCSVTLKWGRQMFREVSIPMSGGFEVFQAQIYSLTSVLPERQKVLYKGRQIREIDPSVLKTGITLLLIGCSDEQRIDSTSGESSASDAEDMQLDIPKEGEHSHLPVILQNLGNTCYLNSTIQFLRTIPELRQILALFNPGDITDAADPHSIHAVSMILALKDLFQSLDESPDRMYSPIYFLDCLQMVAPSFAQKDKNGSLQQQDADECLSVILRLLSSKLPPLRDYSRKHNSFVDQYLTGKFLVKTKCIESDEPPTTSEETFTKLSCFISQEVKFMTSGLRLSFNEELSKFNETLQRDAKYSRNYRISRLPAYLTVHFMRFFYKEKVNMNTKILREVKFPLVLDAFEFCTEELQDNLQDMRERFRDDTYDYLEAPCKHHYYKDGPCSSLEELIHSFSFEDDSGSNNSGYYDLRAIITHKGRTSQAGHYVCWVRLHDGWVKIDDDVRILNVPEEDILRLAGGSDIHTAYMLLYGPKLLRRRRDEDTSSCMEIARI